MTILESLRVRSILRRYHTPMKMSYFSLLVVLSTLLMACRGSDQPTEVDLGVLVEQQSHYAGKMITTWGVLRTFDQPRHYWIETPDFKRVGVAPNDAVAPYVNQLVEVTGRFNTVESAGRQLLVDSIQVYR